MITPARSLANGRPTKFRPAYCDLVEELGKKGKSPAQMAASLDVDRTTLIRWSTRYPTFAQAFARARTYAQAHWEDLGQAALETQGFQGQVWLATMRARFTDYQRLERTADCSFLGDLLRQRQRRAETEHNFQISSRPGHRGTARLGRERALRDR